MPAGTEGALLNGSQQNLCNGRFQFPQFRLNAGITSLANQRSCSLNSWGGNPSAQWIIKFSRPGYFASTDLMPAITSAGGPQNQAFCATPSFSNGVRAAAPGEPQTRPCSSA